MRFDFSQEAYFDNHTHLLYTDVLSVKPDEFAVNYYHGVRDAVNKDGKAAVSDEAKKHLPYQGVIMMLVNAMSQKFGCEPTIEGATALRNSLTKTPEALKDYTRMLFEDENICGVMLDAEHPMSEPVGDCFPCKVFRLFRYEDVFFSLLKTETSYRALLEKLLESVRQAHIEGFGSSHGVYEGKSEILDAVLERGGIGIVPSSSEWIDEWKKDYKEAFSQGKMLTFGFNDDDFVKVSEVESSANEVSFILTAKGQSEHIKLNLLGKHNAQNAAAAAALCLALGCDFKYIKPGLENTASVKGRLQVKKFSGFTLIDDAYNASFNAVLSGIDTLSSFAGFKVMVFGDMGELGDEAVSLHEKVGLYAKNKINLLLCLGPLSRHSVEKAGGIARHFDSHEELGAFLKDEVLKQHKDAVILVKGSHAMRMDLITDKLIALSESKDSIK